MNEKKTAIKQLLTDAWMNEKRFDKDTKTEAYIYLLEKKNNLKIDNISGLFYVTCRNLKTNQFKRDINRQTFLAYESEIIMVNCIFAQLFEIYGK